MAGQVVLVTGCSEGGIGFEICRAFAARGCQVFATARRLQSMQNLKHYGVQLLQLDVTDSGSVRQAVNAVITAAGRLDVLVNNAGVVVLGPTAEVPLQEVKAAFAANVFGLLAMVQVVTPFMAAAGSGRIINIGSLTGFTPVPLRGVYGATKAAVMRLSDALRIELGLLGVQVMLVAHGFIQSNARVTAKDAALTYSSSSLWGNWLDVLEAATAKLLVKAVPAQHFAQQLVAAALQPQMPRHWVGPCAGLEWLLRYFPLWLQLELTYHPARK
ncbi:hypothetical protein COO60DRAFT_1697448 [Scenedesmus sp. NREL 46B-D3]|nr:hypothetical protein COO60DRAFT_1697448 [Scenedesmus sp. NREL 46B-D3]